jgi:hypothetical protein
VIEVTRKILIEGLGGRYPYWTMNDLPGYGLMMFTKHPCHFYEKPFTTSKWKRSLLIAEPIHGLQNHPLTIATSHFESLANHQARKSQMREAFSLMPAENSIICGDYNFDDAWQHETQVYEQAGYEEVLKKYVPETAFTMYKTSKGGAVRFDKILLSRSSLEPTNGFICGKFATPLFA